jgi:hypothetical protein
VDGEGEEDGEGEVDGAGDVRDGDADGAGVLRTGEGLALVAPAGAAAGGAGRDGAGRAGDGAGRAGDGAGRAGAGAVRAGDGALPVALGVVLDAGANTPPPSPGPEACGRCEAPAVMATVIPAVMASAAATATVATAPGRRRTRRHHDGPEGPIAFGKPVGPNTPARCATLIRRARPSGELSAQAVSTRSRNLGASGSSGGSAP